MEKLLTHCLITVATVTFKTAGQSPPRPLLCLPRRWLGRAPEPASGCPRMRPGSEGRAGRRGLSIWLARRTRWAAHPGSRQGLSIFSAEEATISQSERQPGLHSLAVSPASSATFSLGVTKPGPRHAPALRPPGERHGVTGAPRTPTALRVALSRPQQPPPHSPRGSDGPLRAEARWPCQPASPWGRGSGLGWGCAASPAGTQPPPSSQSLCAK